VPESLDDIFEDVPLPKKARLDLPLVRYYEIYNSEYSNKVTAVSRNLRMPHFLLCQPFSSCMVSLKYLILERRPHKSIIIWYFT
jgi:hypothetical protein